MVGILFIIGCIAFYFYTTNKSNKEHLENKVKELEKEKFWTEAKINSLEKEINKSTEQLDDQDELEDFGYTSEMQYNNAIDEIEKSIKYSPLERIYYESELPDQLKNEISLRIKTKEHLAYLANKGITENDISSARNIISQREDIIGTALNLKSFVEDYIQQKGKVLTEEIFLGLVKIFQVAGRDISTSDKVYTELFEDLLF